MTKKSEESKQENTFSKQEILASKRFANRVDLLKAILDDKKSYVVKEVEEIIEDFLKRKV